MGFHNYMHSFYHECIFTIDELEEHLGDIKIAENIEKELSKHNSNIDIIRELILRSFKFRKDLSFADRYNYVKGMIYSRQFLNEDDIDAMEKSFENDQDDKIIAKSVFGIRNYTDNFDYEFYYNYLDNIRFENSEDLKKKAKRIDNLIKKSKERYEKDLRDELKFEEAEKEKVEEEDAVVVEVEETVEEELFDISDLSFVDRIIFAKKYYPIYKKGIFKSKKIKKRGPEYKMISAGMDDQFNMMIHLYENTYRIFVNDFVRKNKNLTLGL
ncbi:MAG: hypothetical protein IJH20_04770 [Bacilli bacterium]|nr:hypothetical protein [Bacilli bacterium]